MSSYPQRANRKRPAYFIEEATRENVRKKPRRTASCRRPRREETPPETDPSQPSSDSGANEGQQPVNHFDRLPTELKEHVLDSVEEDEYGERGRIAMNLRRVNRRNAAQYARSVARLRKDFVLMLNPFGMRQLEWVANSALAPHIQHVIVCNVFVWPYKLVLVNTLYGRTRGDEGTLPPQDSDERDALDLYYARSDRLWNIPRPARTLAARYAQLRDVTANNRAPADNLALLDVTGPLEGIESRRVINEEKTPSDAVYNRAALLLSRFMGAGWISTGLIRKIIAEYSPGVGRPRRKLQPIYVHLPKDSPIDYFHYSTTSGLVHLSRLVARIPIVAGGFGSAVDTLDLCYCSNTGDGIPQKPNMRRLLAQFRNVDELEVGFLTLGDRTTSLNQYDLFYLRVADVLTERPFAFLYWLTVSAYASARQVLRLMKAHRATLTQIDQDHDPPDDDATALFARQLQIIKSMPRLRDVNFMLAGLRNDLGPLQDAKGYQSILVYIDPDHAEDGVFGTEGRRKLTLRRQANMALQCYADVLGGQDMTMAFNAYNARMTLVLTQAQADFTAALARGERDWVYDDANCPRTPDLGGFNLGNV